MENENIPMEETTETTDAFLDGWDGAEVTETTENETLEEATEKPEESTEEVTEGTTEETPEKPEETTEKTEEAPRLWALRHLGEEKSVNEQEMTALAQKGLDYDRVREKYDAAKPVMEMFTQMAKQSNMTVEQYVSYVRTEAKKAAGLSDDEAKREVALEDRESAVSVEESEKQFATEAEERRSADIAEFQKTFPDAAKDVGNIPQEVWDAVKQGQRLTVAYAVWREKQAIAEAERVKQESAAKEQNAKNNGRSTGSMKTAGAERKASDPFLEGFNS
jgi:hypothetical protein